MKARMFAMRFVQKGALGGVSQRWSAGVKNGQSFRHVIQRTELSTNTRPKPKAPTQNLSVAIYCGSVAVFVLGVAYASVPLYKVFCSMTGKDRKKVNLT